MKNLLQAIGEPEYYFSADEKSLYTWVMETEDGTVFTIYDWKEYRRIKDDEVITWHIGGFNRAQTERAAAELESALALNSKNK